MAFMQKQAASFTKASVNRVIPNGDHLVRVRGLRRIELKTGAGIVNIDLQIVKSLVNSVEVIDYAGKEFDVRYYLPIDNEDMFNKTFERLVERDLKHVMGGKIPEGDFTDDKVFEQWGKEAIGRGAWVNYSVSDKVDKEGKPYTNVYFNKSADVPAAPKGAVKPSAQEATKAAADASGAPDYAAKSDDDDDDIPF